MVNARLTELGNIVVAAASSYYCYAPPKAAHQRDLGDRGQVIGGAQRQLRHSYLGRGVVLQQGRHHLREGGGGAAMSRTSHGSWGEAGAHTCWLLPPPERSVR